MKNHPNQGTILSLVYTSVNQVDKLDNCIASNQGHQVAMQYLATSEKRGIAHSAVEK